MRTVHVGLFGFGAVGQAIARVCLLGRSQLRARGLDLVVAHALVRDARRPRGVGSPTPALVDDPEVFFRHRHDVVVEVLGGVEPASAYVRRVLARGTPVVTANKSLVAAQGEDLKRLAARVGTCLRFEACALAGVPFIGTLGRRPLVASLTRLSAVLNGTSNFILTAMARERVPFAEALRRAKDLGLAEPDPSKDVGGVDAAEKLALLVTHFGTRALRPDVVETSGIDLLDPGDLAQAEAFGGAIKPVAHATFDGEVTRAFVGPAFVPAAHPLAEVTGRLNGIALDGRFVDGLFFSGPGAGPDVTAATLLDDVVEAVTGLPEPPTGASRDGLRPEAICQAPITPWFVRFRFSKGVPDEASLYELLGAHRLWLRHPCAIENADSPRTVRALTHTCTREHLQRALDAVQTATGGSAWACRVLEN